MIFKNTHIVQNTVILKLSIFVDVAKEEAG